MKCAGCDRELEVGDRYIEDTPSGFMAVESDPLVEEIMVGLLGGSGGKLFFCEDCTVPGGDYLFETVYGDEEET